MRVLVTGTDGYIGVVLAPFLLQCGYDIVGLDTDFTVMPGSTTMESPPCPR